MKIMNSTIPGMASASGSKTSQTHDFYASIGKRLFDVAFSLVLLPILIPVVALLWLMVKSDGGNGFYGHTRIGQNGRAFKCWKLRSMCVDSDARLAEYLATNAEAAAQWQSDFKLDNDPRITRLGQFIRKTSLDELPQIWNVLKGEMSLVGPRPVIAEELERYGNRVSTYYSLRPGVTGAWQVSGRNDVSYGRRVALDVQYARNMSLLTDLGIILATAGAMLQRTGK